jgi:plasmid stabilization system protein ParE
MLRIEYSAQIADDIDRIVEHLVVHKVPDPLARIDEILLAIDVLAVNPCIGRPLPGGRRELVIGRDHRGYLARYRYLEMRELVLIEAIRSQHEAGFVDSSSANR